MGSSISTQFSENIDLELATRHCRSWCKCFPNTTMSKQRGYQQMSSEEPSGEDYGFAARLGKASASGSGEGERAAPVAYPPAAAYASAPYAEASYAGAPFVGAPVAGYPVMTTPTQQMAGPVGLVAPYPLGRKQARRLARANGGCRDCRNCRGCRRRRGGPVSLLVRLVRSAVHSAQEHTRNRTIAPASQLGST